MARLVTQRAAAEATARPLSVLNYEAALGRLAIAAGLAFSLIGLTDLGLLLFPTDFGTPEWEFATIGQILESLAITTLGFGLLAAGVVSLGVRIGQYIAGTFFTLFTLALLGGLVIFALVAPVALHASPPAMKKTLMVIVFKNSVLGLVYFVVFFYYAYACFKARNSRI